MPIMNEKNIKTKRYMKGIAKRVNSRVLRVGIIPCLRGGKLLRKYKNKKEVENMENTITNINNKISEIKSVNVTSDGEKVAKSLRIVRLKFLKNAVEKKELSTKDPIINTILEEKKYV